MQNDELKIRLDFATTFAVFCEMLYLIGEQLNTPGQNSTKMTINGIENAQVSG